MKRAGPSRSWFSVLRRDKELFALVGALTILLGLLQPLAAARNAAFQDLLVLCSAGEAPAGQLPAQAPNCPLCPTGHLCGLHGAPVVMPQVAALPLAFQETLPPPARRTAGAPAFGGEAPPSIRAPPLSA